MVELVDTLALGASAARREGSSPFIRTSFMKYLLLFAVLLFVFMTAWVFWRHGRHGSLSFSMHVAKSQSTSLIFGIAGLIATTAAFVTVLFALLPSLNASTLTYVIFLIIFGQFFVAIVFPHIEGSRSGSIHNFAAWGMCFTIPVAIAALLFTDISTLLWLFTALSLLIKVVLLTIALSFGIVPKREGFLYYQLSYISLFLILLLAIAFSQSI